MKNTVKRERGREGEGEQGRLNANNEKFQAVFKCFIGFLIMFAHQRGPHMRNKRPPTAAKLKLKLKQKLEHSCLHCDCDLGLLFLWVLPSYARKPKEGINPQVT